MFYIPKHFKAYELVPKSIYEKYGDFSLSVMNNGLLAVIDRIKEDYSHNFPVYINDWYWGGTRNQSGLRETSFYKGLSLSQHLYGNAVDMIFSHITETRSTKQQRIDSYNAIRQSIIGKIKSGEEPYINIKGIEDDIAWLHIDVRNIENLMRFKP